MSTSPSPLQGKRHSLQIQVETKVDDLLVLTDTHMSGWKARIDGYATQVYVAGHAFRAVVVPAGAHQIEFKYGPWSVRIGAVTSLLAATASVLVVLWQWIRHRRHSR